MSRTYQFVLYRNVAYARPVPKLWDETIEDHRRAVRDATMDATAALVAEHGLRAVTMSRIAEETGIGRATLYRYFPDVETILSAWHERRVRAHLKQLVRLRDEARSAIAGLEAVLGAYALIQYERPQHEPHDSELAALMHGDAHVAQAQRELGAFVCDLLARCVEADDIRDDVAPEELASYCIHALGAAGGLPSKAAVRRLVAVTLTGLRAR